MAEIEITRRGPARVQRSPRNLGTTVPAVGSAALTRSLGALEATVKRELEELEREREKDLQDERRRDVNTRLGEAAGGFDEVIAQAEETNFFDPDEVAQLDEATETALNRIAGKI